MSTTKQPPEKKRVIDADNNKVLEWFTIPETEDKVKHYQSLGKWKDVSVDHAGDIILWEDK